MKMDYDSVVWCEPDEYTKDLLIGAVATALIGGSNTPYATYELTICSDANGTFIPVHGMVKMQPVATIQAAKAALVDYWNDLAPSAKLKYRCENFA